MAKLYTTCRECKRIAVWRRRGWEHVDDHIRHLSDHLVRVDYRLPSADDPKLLLENNDESPRDSISTPQRD